MSNQNNIPRGQYVVAAPVLTTGQLCAFRLDSDGVLLTRATGGGSLAPTRFNSAGDVASLAIKAAAGTLFDIEASNNNAASRFFQLFNATALPVNGTVPSFLPLTIPAGGVGSFFFGESGLAMSTGIVAALSTTRTTLTVAGADMWVSGRFV